MITTEDALYEKIEEQNQIIKDQDQLIKLLQNEVLQWKANHADQVTRSRVLKERLDMPVERIKAYDTITELQSKVRQLENKEVNNA